MSLYCDDCGFAIDPQCMCKIPGKAERTTRELPAVAEDDTCPHCSASRMANGGFNHTNIRCALEMAKPVSTPRPKGSHADCTHEKTKAARAACRKARAMN